jgi:ribose 5-phosphate isomerase B
MSTDIEIAIACDHAGYRLKEQLLDYFKEQGIKYTDFGAHSQESVDYPDFAHPMAWAIEQNRFTKGISLCGSGNGINMVANKYPSVRSALCWSGAIAALARAHNNANVCALPARFLNFDEARHIVQTFLKTPFDGGRHERRIRKIPCIKT